MSTLDDPLPIPARPLVSVYGDPENAGRAGRYPGEKLTPPGMPPVDFKGSRRHRLWELPPGTLCPLMGVCLPIAILRRVLAKTVGGSLGDDYQAHCAAINECTRRNATSEAIQRELDLRHSLAVQRFAKAKCADAVAVLWRDESLGTDPSGALWAGLTHPRCDNVLRERICGDVHMLQHQLGVGNRADLQRLETLGVAHAAVKRELAATRERHALALAERQRAAESLQADLLRLRANALLKDSLLAALQDELAQHKTPSSVHELQALRQRTAQLERELAESRRTARREGRRADELAARFAEWTADHALPASEDHAPGTADVAPLRDAAVLCVGGRTASVPVYRRLIEVTGGRFAHHDGGAQQSVAQLESSLAAADLVICQTGCISHDAYWRVKDHCKRHGKRCVFVDNPSAANFARSLRAMPERA